MITTQLYFMPDVEVTCGACKGARFNSETLEVTLRGKTIDDVLNMSVEEGVTFFAGEPAVGKKIEVLNDLGLGYLTLGQSATTLSGGEAQRIKIATELSKLQRSKHTVYILDEPTTGLHLADVERLLESLNRLVDAGHTVLLIEHHLDVIKTADHVIDLGPGGRARRRRGRGDRHAGRHRRVQGVAHGAVPEGALAGLASRVLTKRPPNATFSGTAICQCSVSGRSPCSSRSRSSPARPTPAQQHYLVHARRVDETAHQFQPILEQHGQRHAHPVVPEHRPRAMMLEPPHGRTSASRGLDGCIPNAALFSSCQVVARHDRQQIRRVVASRMADPIIERRP